MIVRSMIFRHERVSAAQSARARTRQTGEPARTESREKKVLCNRNARGSLVSMIIRRRGKR